MANVTIQDKGFYDVSGNFPSSGIGSEEIAYGTEVGEPLTSTKGTVININAVSITMTMETSKDDSVPIQKKDDNNSNKRFEFGEIDKTGIGFPKWTIRGAFKTTDVIQARNYGRLVHCVKTKGYKQIAITAVDNAEILSYSKYGEREYDAEGTKTILNFNCRIINFTVDQVVKKGEKIEYTLVVMETK